MARRKQITLEEAVEEFIGFITPNAEYSVNTTTQYTRTLRRWLQHPKVNARMKLVDVRREHAEMFVANRGASTRNTYLATIRSMLTYHVEEGNLQKDPLVRVRPVKGTPKVPVYVPAQDLPRIVDAAPNPLERMVIVTGLLTLCRVSDLAAMRVGDVDFDLVDGEGRARPGIVMVDQKTRKADRIPMGPTLVEEMRSYLSWYAQHLVDHEGMALMSNMYLFPRRERGSKPRRDESGRITAWELKLAPWAPNARLTAYVNAALEACGYRALGTGGHTLRRSGGRAAYYEAIDDGHDNVMDRLRLMYRHSSITMTERYLGVDRGKEERDRLYTEQDLVQLQPRRAILREVGGS